LKSLKKPQITLKNSINFSDNIFKMLHTFFKKNPPALPQWPVRPWCAYPFYRKRDQKTKKKVEYEKI
jgi:hypothetical protein